MGLYDTDYDILTERTMPVRLRVAIHKAWLKCLVSPVRYLNTLFQAFRAATLYRLAHNSQVCKMEGMLNDTFDNTDRRIYISDPTYYDPIYVYRNDELKPVYVATDGELPVIDYDAPVYAYTDDEIYVGGGAQFIVNVPAVLGLDADRVRAAVDDYRLAGKKNFQIVTF